MRGDTSQKDVSAGENSPETMNKFPVEAKANNEAQAKKERKEGMVPDDLEHSDLVTESGSDSGMDEI